MSANNKKNDLPAVNQVGTRASRLPADVVSSVLNSLDEYNGNGKRSSRFSRFIHRVTRHHLKACHELVRTIMAADQDAGKIAQALKAHSDRFEEPRGPKKGGFYKAIFAAQTILQNAIKENHLEGPISRETMRNTPVRRPEPVDIKPAEPTPTRTNSVSGARKG